MEVKIWAKHTSLVAMTTTPEAERTMSFTQGNQARSMTSTHNRARTREDRRTEALVSELVMLGTVEFLTETHAEKGGASKHTRNIHSPTEKQDTQVRTHYSIWADEKKLRHGYENVFQNLRPMKINLKSTSHYPAQSVCFTSCLPLFPCPLSLLSQAAQDHTYRVF